MKPGFMLCPRCDGRKKMFKMGSGYSHCNCGGPEVDCPMCTGKGELETLETVTARGKAKLDAEKSQLNVKHQQKRKSKQVDIEEYIGG